MGRAWVKLPTDYQRRLDIALAAQTAATRVAAELLWARAWAWCGEAESAGFVPRSTVTTALGSRLPVAETLVDTGLWEAMPSGFNVLGWEEIAGTPEEITARRLADAARKRKQRSQNLKSQDVSRDMSQPESRDVTRAELEVDAATASQQQHGQPLPPRVEILRSKLDARRLVVRWDGLTAAQLDEIATLQELHGDGPLVQAALNAFRPESPAVYAQAWLGSWRALPHPSQGLALVTEKCPEHLIDLPCGGCAADLKGAL